MSERFAIMFNNFVAYMTGSGYAKMKAEFGTDERKWMKTAAGSYVCTFYCPVYIRLYII